MKVVDELKVGGRLRAGCTCSEGRTKTRGLWDPFWNCNCQCSKGNDNYNANNGKADRK